MSPTTEAAVAGFEDLHLPPSIAAALERLGWSPDDPLVRKAAPSAARGHNLALVLPPCPAAATPALAGLLARLGEGAPGLVLAPAGQLDEWGRVVHHVAGAAPLRVQVAHGTARATRRLRDGAVDLVAATPETALALQRRSALRAEALTWVLLAWPEAWEDEESLTPLMQDLPKDAQRVLLTSMPERAAGLVERYARRALTLDESAATTEPAGPVRTVSVPWGRRVAALPDLLELLDPATVAVWTVDRSHHEAIAAAAALRTPEGVVVTGDAPAAQVVVAFDLPDPARLRQLVGAGAVVLLVPPGTEGYVERIASPRRPIRLPGALDAATTLAAARRAAIVRTLETASTERALLTLAPLFERHDPAAIAAALFELWTSSAGAAAPAAVPDIAATARVYMGIGRKDGATVNDIVAVLTKEVRVDRGKIGRVDLRDTFALVELPAQEAEQIAGRLNGTTIRRRRVTARVDRGVPPRRGPRPPPEPR